METDTANAMGLYRNAGPESNPADVGTGTGNMLYNAELSARTRYAEPIIPKQEALTKPTGAPDYYNYQPALPVKYSVPSAAKERLVARQAIRDAAGGAAKQNSNVIRTDPISDEEVNYLQAMQDQAELADFDRYVNSLVDPRKPGNLKWLMEIYPEFVNRRISQVHTDYEYALRNQMIDSWGINTFDDLHFKYLVDQNKIKGPSLETQKPASGLGYSTGILGPAAWKPKRLSGVRLPFASARVGAHATGEGGNTWIMPDDGMPLGTNRGMQYMASSIYGNANGDNNAQPFQNNANTLDWGASGAAPPDAGRAYETA